MKIKLFTKITFYLIIMLVYSCKRSIETNKSNEKENLIAGKALKVGSPKGNIDDFKGIWESFSYYLEHESEFKDFNSSKYYKIIKDKEILEITIPKRNLDSAKIFIGQIGFIDSINSELTNKKNKTFQNLETIGNILVESTHCINDRDNRKINKSKNFERYFEITEILYDGFDYGKDEDVNFKIINALPVKIFELLKINSSETYNLIKDFNLRVQSSKIKVVSNKTYFYNGMTEDTKRKAFLIKNDVAYLEDITGEWAKIYYDGKTITSGYVKLKDVSVIH